MLQQEVIDWAVWRAFTERIWEEKNWRYVNSVFTPAERHSSLFGRKFFLFHASSFPQSSFYFPIFFSLDHGTHVGWLQKCGPVSTQRWVEPRCKIRLALKAAMATEAWTVFNLHRLEMSEAVGGSPPFPSLLCEMWCSVNEQ